MKKLELINIGISACLTGEPVRYDGGHSCIAKLCEYMSSMFTLVPLCPELAIGMGVPRAPIQLVGEPDTARALGVESPALDVTDELSGFARNTLKGLPVLDGFVMKSRSPSCGLASTPVFDNNGRQTGTGSGVFTRTLRATRPAIPLIDELCVDNQMKMDRFALQVCVYAAFRRQVLENEDKYAAMHRFRENLVSMSAMKRTPRLVLPAQLPVSMKPEAFIRQYMVRLGEQSPAKDHEIRQPGRIDGSQYYAEQLTGLLEKLGY